MNNDNLSDNLNVNEQNKHKKATNRDVAKLAGVSVATVSYVINGREDQRISEATKKKVYQAMNFLNYSPNPYAVGLNTEQPQTITVRSSSNASYLTEMEILHFMRNFNLLCEKKKIQLNYSLDKRAAKIAATACICFDLPNEEFHRFAEENFIPVIAIESLVGDPVFYQITTDFERVYAAAADYFNDDFTFVYIEPNNMETKEKILSVFKKVIFLSSLTDIGKIAQGKNIALSQPALFPLFESLDTFKVFKYFPDPSKLSQTVMECIEKALNRLNTPDRDHFIKI